LRTRLCTLTASAALAAVFGLSPSAAFGASATASCGKPTSSGTGNNWRTDCKVVFSNGPRVKIRYTQTGSTVKVKACAYGRRPKGFENLSVTSELSETSNAQVAVLRLRSGSTCSLSGKTTVALWGSLTHGMLVRESATLFWKKQSVTGATIYRVA
jgi:hypothetical protein